MYYTIVIESLSGIKMIVLTTLLAIVLIGFAIKFAIGAFLLIGTLLFGALSFVMLPVIIIIIIGLIILGLILICKLLGALARAF